MEKDWSFLVTERPESFLLGICYCLADRIDRNCYSSATTSRNKCCPCVICPASDYHADVSNPKIEPQLFMAFKRYRLHVFALGNTLLTGYYKRPDLTNEVIVDGWFHTGDIGEWQPDGTMKIIDRKKNIFKLSQGEYIAVENLENIYSCCPLIASIWVYGNSFESFLVAVVVPDKKALEDWAEDHNETGGDFVSLCKNTKARKYFQEELKKIGQKNKV